jgi:ABC-type transport system involved in multi-copper enzyme maturation permease subunit
MNFLRSPLTSLRLTFRWSNSVQTWHERVGDLILLLGIAGAALITWLNGTTTFTLPWGFSFMLTLPTLLWWQVLLVWVVFLAPALPFSIMGWLKVFGPVLYYDMVRQARRSKFIFLRLLYALLLVFLLFCVAMGHSTRFRTDSRVAAAIAENFFDVFTVTQFITVVLLTPAYVGGAIAEEKDRKTLEFMLATDLLNREIVLSKLGSRLANLALIVMTGLPILSILQFLGGVDPNLVIAEFVITAMTIVGLAGFSMLCSVTCRKPREAISLAYLGVVLYYALSLVLWLSVLLSWRRTTSFLDDVYKAGNLVFVYFDIKEAGRRGSLATDLPEIVRNYTLFHGVVFLACTALAVARIRRVALVQTYGKPIKERRGWRLWPRPQVGSLPMLWKEIHCEGRGTASWISWLVFSLLLGLTFIPPVIILVVYAEDWYQPVRRWNNLAMRMNVWLSLANLVVGCLTGLAVAVRASNTVTSERDKQTFDTLLTTPLDSTSILHAKWMGSLLGARFGLVWLAAIWAVGIVTGGLHIVALPFVLTAWLVYAAFAATLGMWFSVVCKSSMRATVLTILACITLGVGHWLPWICCGFLMAMSGANSEAMGQLARAQAGLLTPPFVMLWMPFSADGYNIFQTGPWDERYSREMTVFSVVGIVGWAFATAVLYAMTSMRFRHVTNRESRMRPDRHFWPSARQRRPRPAAGPISPWAPPTGPAALAEAEPEAEEDDENFVEPLDHDEYPDDWRGRH